MITTLHLNLTLLDDMHTGNGLGHQLIDSLQAKDAKGNPVISRQHIKGLFKEAADKYNLCINENSSDKAIFDKLLNSKLGEQEGTNLVFGSFYYNDLSNTETDEPYIVWSSSARGKNGDDLNRAPKDDTLRAVEYVKAGSTFTAKVTLFSPDHLHQEYLDKIKLIFKRIDRIGASRNRGAGGLLLKATESESKNQANKNAPLNIAAQGSCYLRFNFTNLEPLRLPASQVPGNVIKTDNYVSSGKLRGALANLARLCQREDIFKALIEHQGIDYQVGLTNAYPGPDKTRSLPWPHSVQLSKACALANSKLPWWAQGSSKQLKDTLNAKATEPNEAVPSFKRNKSPSYLYFKDASDANTCFVHKQSKGIHMRNAVRTQYEQKLDDDSALFSEEVLVENSHFNASLSFNCPELANKVANWFSQLKQQNTPFLLGRGMAPCEITETQVCEGKEPVYRLLEPQANSITLVLASEWLIYNQQNLQTEQELSIELVLQVFGLEDQFKSESFAGKWESRSETCTLSGFNFATGLPKKALTVLAPGSVIRVEHPELVSALIACSKEVHAVGERTQQGLGRYWLYQGGLKPQLKTKNSQSKSENIREQHHAIVNRLLTENISGSKSQWLNLGSALKRLERQQTPKVTKQDINELLAKYESQSSAGLKAFMEGNRTLLKQWKKELSNISTLTDAFSLSNLLVDLAAERVKANKEAK
ncbi:MULTISPECIES: RAMP superfamily CRISPR-associated protein [unclassified Agarivorans]|uniref:RAMP superfamily CRISPR-associated protein n=1 Tax=unclassified Agarivorans TaxID=2636026 RepID=UPI003D7E0570